MERGRKGFSSGFDEVNPFEILGVEARPLPDPEVVKERYLELSGQEHPDRVEESGRSDAVERSMRLNGAFKMVSKTSARLRALLEEEGVEVNSHAQRIPPDLSDLFMSIGMLWRELDGFLIRCEASETELERAMMAKEVVAFLRRLQEVQGQVFEKRQELNETLVKVDEGWMRGERDLKELEVLYQREAFVEKWEEQAGERMHRISGVL